MRTAGLRRALAPKAERRACHSLARSSGVLPTSTEWAPRLRQISAERSCVALDPLGEAVHLDQEHGFDVGVEAGRERRFHGFEGVAVEHFQGGCDEAGGDDLGDGFASGFELVEGGEDNLDGLRDGAKLEDHLGGEAEGALRAGEEADQIVARRVRNG